MGEISLTADEIPKGMKSAAADRVDLISPLCKAQRFHLNKVKISSQGIRLAISFFPRLVVVYKEF
ncbi:MAG: hypothetical protein PHG06_21040 [Parabacteroides sp.]|nr:hypothetical protein [Parabacteroides sp.]